MLIGYARVSTGDQSLDLQIDALVEAGVAPRHIYTDKISSVKDKRPGLDDLMKVLREGDIVVVWKMDRLFRSLSHMVNTMTEFHERGVQFRSLTEPHIDTTTAHGRFMFHVWASMAEFERELIQERTMAGLKAARARGRIGGRRRQMTLAKAKQAAALIKDKTTSIQEICETLQISHTTLYHYVSPEGELRVDEKVFEKKHPRQ